MRSQVWAVDVTAFPEGSHDEEGVPVPGWEPPNWAAERASLQKAGYMEPGETAFFWPLIDKVYLSRGTAETRAKLLARYGCTVDVVRSPLVWEPVRTYPQVTAPKESNAKWVGQYVKSRYGDASKASKYWGLGHGGAS